MEQRRDEDFMTTKEAAEWLRLREDTLRAWRCQGRGPRWVRLGRTAIRYRVADVRRWMEEGEER